MTLLVLKLVATPLLIGGATLAGRRWGGAVSGWLVGLPLTSGPVSVFLAVQHGRAFAARAAVGSIGGVVGEAAFFVVWGLLARRPAWAAIGAGSAAFAAVALAARQPWPIVPLAAVAAASVVAAIRMLPPARPTPKTRPPRWDIPVRAVVATTLVIALTEASTTLGPRLTGIFAVYPLYSIVLAAFARSGALHVLRGVLYGLFAFIAFFLVVGVVLPHVSIALGYTLAVVAALVVQLASFRPVAAAAGRLDADDVAGV